MLFRRRAGLLFIACLIASIVFSQQKWPSTFFWRVSGKTLARPSYLYGTIHLQDKRLFQFTDSLYRALETVEGFALEIDFNEFMDSIFSRSFRQAEDELLDRQEVKLDRKKLNKTADTLLETLGIREDRITKKDLKKIRDYRMNKLVQQGEMQTIVDGYLFGLAQRLGKWMGGIEDVNDQLGLIDELGGDLSPEEVFQPEANLRKSLNEMIRLYINRDLESLAGYVDGKYEQGIRDKLLTQRNMKMARRMDSLMAIRTMFFGVGVAHLPGDSGVISLLRSRGLIVEPVFSPQSLTPEAYASNLNAIPWKKIDDDKLYSIEMPSLASDYNFFGDAVKMKVCFDLPTMTYYMAGHSIAGNNNSAALDEAFRNMAERMGSRSGKIPTKEITVGDARGKEGIFEIAEASFKVRLLQKKNVLYILLAGSTKKSNLSTPGVDKFFSSFVARDIIANENKWEKFTVPGKAFSLVLPGTPKSNRKVDEVAVGSGWEFTTYDLVDEEKGFYYIVQVRDLRPGYYLESDSAYFSNIREDLSGKFDKIISEEQFRFHGWPALKLVTETDGIIFKIMNIVRGNRIYAVVIGGGTMDSDFSDIERVFNSMSLEDYAPSDWKTYATDGFSTTAPAVIQKMEKDSTWDMNSGVHYVSYNSADAISYEILRTPLSAFYWAKDDSSFFSNRLKLYKSYSDSIMEQRVSFNGALKSWDVIIQKQQSNILEKIRMLVNGDTLYTLVAFIPKQHANNPYCNRFFDEFRLVNEVPPRSIQKKQNCF